MKANLTRGNSITENYQPHPIDVLFSVMQEYAKVMNPIPRHHPKGNSKAPGGVAIVGECGQELIINKKGEAVIPHKKAIIQNAKPIKVNPPSSDEWNCLRKKWEL